MASKTYSSLNVMKKLSFQSLLVGIAIFLAYFLSISNGMPMKSRASTWLSSSDHGSDNYHATSNQFGYEPFNSHHAEHAEPPTIIRAKPHRGPNTTLAAILLFAVLGIGATAFFVIVCSKMAKHHQYDPMTGAVH